MKKIIALMSVAFLLSACTLSFQNVDTHGIAEDLIDENLSTTPTANVTVPVSPTPALTQAF